MENGTADAELIGLAEGAYRQAYAPYSKFRVGAALLTEAGTTVIGCNVEDATMNLGVCAERAAIISAIVKEGPKMKIRAMAVASEQPGGCAPCGNCRQLFSEFSDETSRIIFHDGTGYAPFTLEDILPHTFKLKAVARV